MANIVNKIGQRFGMLVVEERLANYKKGRTYYRCKCDCGNETIVQGSHLGGKNNHTKSCGCQSSRNGTRQYDFLHQFRMDDMKPIYLIYKHTAPNGKIYIGMTKQSVERRSQNGKGYISQRVFYNAIKKYGWDNFKHEILENNLTHDEACDKERYYISYYKSNIRKHGYNITSGGDGCDCEKKGVHVVQKYNGNVINCFKTLNKASEQLGICSSTVKNYIENHIEICGFTFEEVDFDDYCKYEYISNPQYLNIKKIKEIEKIKTTMKSNEQNNNKKKINQYSLNGEYLNTYLGVVETQRKLGIFNISNAIINNTSAGGYQWRYDNGDHSNISNYHCNGKIVLQYDKDFKYINQFQSMKEAERCTGIGFRQIWKVCNGQNKTAGGYIWKYADEVENNVLETAI